MQGKNAADVLVFLKQSLRMEQATWAEGPATLHSYLLAADAGPRRIEGAQLATLLCGMFKATVRARPEDCLSLVEKLAACEASLADNLRQITRQELEQGARYAVLPLFAAVVGTPSKD